ncbi:hypothetical protein BH23CHL1_BH23CHL1_27300 [soil metagenome]
MLLRIKHDYRITMIEVGRDRYDAVTTAYSYHIYDLQDGELIAFHWHPSGISPVTYPHMHLSSRVRPILIEDPAHPNRQPDSISFSDMHIPTGPVLFENVVRLLIEEFGVVALRPDWDEILRRNEALLRASD